MNIFFWDLFGDKILAIVTYREKYMPDFGFLKHGIGTVYFYSFVNNIIYSSSNNFSNTLSWFLTNNICKYEGIAF